MLILRTKIQRGLRHNPYYQVASSVEEEMKEHKIRCPNEDKGHGTAFRRNSSHSGKPMDTQSEHDLKGVISVRRPRRKERQTTIHMRCGLALQVIWIGWDLGHLLD